MTVRRLQYLAIAVLLVIGLKLISLAALDARSDRAYAADDWDAAESRLQLLHVGNVVARDLVHFNEGDAQYRDKRYGTAERSFRDALDRAPASRDCRARRNLELAIEAQADAALKKKDAAGSLRHLKRAQEVIDDDPDCRDTHADDQDSKEALDAAAARLADKQKAQSPDEAEPAPGEPGEPTPAAPAAPAASVQAKLAQRQAAAQGERADDSERASNRSQQYDYDRPHGW